MKIALLADAHLISSRDPDAARRRRRAHFGEAWPSFRALVGRINRRGLDLAVILGDLVDWYSEANRDFALELLGELRCPWLLTPGNHDLAVPGIKDREAAAAVARRGWAQAGVALANRVVELDRLRLLLVESALSRVPAGTEAWLAGLSGAGAGPAGSAADDLPGGPAGARNARPIVCTHVPLDIPPVVEYILSVQAKDLNKYVQRGSPHLFDAALRGRVQAVYSGHLHFPGRLTVDGTRMELLPLCIEAVGRHYDGMGQARVLETGRPSDPQDLS